jgi:large repetitive protein
VIMTSSACATPLTVTSNPITMQVNQQVNPSVSISASATSICSGTSVQFTATPVNGGSAPVYEWRRNGIVVGSNSPVFSSNTLANGDVIQLAMTSSLACAVPANASANTITMSVTPSVQPAIQINGVTTVTLGASSPLTASVSNAGPGPSFQWQDSTASHGWQPIAGAVSPVLNYAPAATGDRIRSILASNVACAVPSTVSSNVLVFTVTPTSLTPVAGAASGIRCYPNPAVSMLVIDSLRPSDQWQELRLMSIDGRQQYSVWKIRNQQQVSIPVASLSSGIYLAVLRRADGRTVYLLWTKQ